MGLVALSLIRFGRLYSPIFFGGRIILLVLVLELYFSFLFSNFNANNTFPELRLVGGSSSGEGRVEILYDGALGTVCDDDWGILDAQVVCRQLGFPSAISAPLKAHFGEGSGEIWLDNVNCLGNETSIERCSHNGWNSHNCVHGEDASVICSSKWELLTNAFCRLTFMLMTS